MTALKPYLHKKMDVNDAILIMVATQIEHEQAAQRRHAELREEFKVFVKSDSDKHLQALSAINTMTGEIRNIALRVGHTSP